PPAAAPRGARPAAAACRPASARWAPWFSALAAVARVAAAPPPRRRHLPTAAPAFSACSCLTRSPLAARQIPQRARRKPARAPPAAIASFVSMGAPGKAAVLVHGSAALADQRVEAAGPLRQVGLLGHPAHAHAEQHVGADDQRAEDLRRDVGAAGVLALGAAEARFDPIDLAIGDLPDRAFELRPLGAAEENAHDVAVGPHVLEHAQVLRGLHLQEGVVPRGALLDVAAGDGAVFGEELRHVALAELRAFGQLAEERIHELAEVGFLGVEVQVERAFRQAAGAGDVLDPCADEAAPGKLRPGAGDEGFLGGGIGGPGHWSVV